MRGIVQNIIGWVKGRIHLSGNFHPCQGQGTWKPSVSDILQTNLSVFSSVFSTRVRDFESDPHCWHKVFNISAISSHFNISCVLNGCNILFFVSWKQFRTLYNSRLVPYNKNWPTAIYNRGDMLLSHTQKKIESIIITSVRWNNPWSPGFINCHLIFDDDLMTVF